MKSLRYSLIVLFAFFIASCSKEELTDPSSGKQTTVNRRSTGQQVDLNVMSYNVLHLPGIAAIKHYKEVWRSKAQHDVLKSLKSNLDVIVFQEGFNQQVEDYLFNPLKSSYPYNTVLVGQYCYTGNYWNTISSNCSNSIFVVNGGVRIFSKYPILEKHQLVFYNSGYGTPDYNSNKGAAYVKIKKDNKIFHIVGTHMQADHGSYNGGSVRMGQLTEIKNWINSFNIPANEPIIYAGDFNVEYTDTPDYNQMKSTLNGVINYTFNPAIDMGTFSNKNTIVKTKYPNYNNTLDYIFYNQLHKNPINTPPMQVLRYMKSGEDLSDHFAIRTDYTFSY